MSEIRPQFFLVRENNLIIPLIALDELPSDISIQGVPRNMNVSETGGMSSVGFVPARGVYYVVDGPHCSVGISEAKNDSFALAPINSKVNGHTVDRKNASTEKPAKVYCSYWIRTGECDFEQQGCRFKHIMPNDLATLETIGLQEIPAWYREKYHVPSLRGRPRAGYTQNNWRKSQKAIEYGNSSVKTEAQSKASSNGKPISPETSIASESISGESQGPAAYKADAISRSTVTNSPSPVTPPNISRLLDFERVGNASFTYKYDAPHTPTGSGPVRSRRLFEAQGPNREYSMSPDSTPSMTQTENSFSSFSSLGGTSRSSPEYATVTSVSTVKHFYASAEDINDADDTLDNLSDELASFDNSEPEHRSISELLDSSVPEDCYGNLILL